MSSHEYLKSICLLGSDRQPLDTSKLGETLQAYISPLKELESSEIILHALALDHYYRLAGRPIAKTTQIHESVPIQEKIENAPENAYKILEKILEVEKQKIQLPLLAQWVKKIVEMKRIVHPMYLVKYFNLLTSSPKKVRTLASPTFGEKGKWLIQQNQKYTNLIPIEQEDVYSFGTSEQRTLFLTNLLQLNPEKAILLLQSNWDTESSKEKLKHLKTLLQHIHNDFLPFLNDLYSNEFSYSANETATQRQSRATIAKALLLIPNSELHQQTLKKLKPYVVEEKGGLLSKVFQTQSEIVQIPEHNDSFFNPMVMLEIYGLNPKSTAMSEYRTDQLYWFGQLCAMIPFEAWSKLTGRKEKNILTSFLKSDQYAITVQGKRESCLKKSLLLLADYYQNDTYILHFLAQEKDKTTAQNLIAKLSVKAWEMYLSNNFDLADNAVLKECPHQEKETWSTAFSKQLIDYIYNQMKNATHWSDYMMGITMAHYLSSKSLDHLLWVNSTKAQKAGMIYNWKNHIFDPIYSTMAIRLEIEQLY
ncbi:MAG: DUF5691 domain-containing protein [Saprospiraceae bacterium]|nr:DUF5691 domain-containing protein [Saprospiraceae bacterium]